MMLKVLGGIDLLSAFIFIMLTFGFDIWTQIMLFSAGLLFVKGFFIFGGDILSVVDLFSATLLILSIFLGLPIILLWIPSFLLLAKGIVSFV